MNKGMGLGGSVVSKNILDRKGNLKWCIKESPINRLDNGCRFFSDIDTDDFLENPSNMVICDWRMIIELEPAVMSIFNMPQGTDITLINENGKKYFIDTNTGKRLYFCK